MIQCYRAFLHFHDLMMETFSKVKNQPEKLLGFLKPKRIGFVGILACFILLYNFDSSYFIEFETPETKDLHDRSGLILDTPGCKIPKLDPYDESVRKIIEKRDPYVCTGHPVFMTAMPNSTIVLNETILRHSYNVSSKQILCSYKAIYRVKPTEKSTRENDFIFANPRVLNFGVPLNEEFLNIQCKLGPNSNYTQYIPLVPLKPEVEKRLSNIKAATKDPLSVILIGIDSVSKLNFLRHFRKTHHFFKSKVFSFDMKGYTKVADNTFPNLVPLLTGHFIEHYWNESVKDKMFFDHLNFIWKAYAKEGFRTFYAEDYPYFGTFQYLKRGFKDPPTDYYYRPMALALDKSDLKKKGKQYCFNNQLDVDMIYGYLRDFVNTMDKRPFFAFAMVSTLTHNYINDAAYADEPTFKLLENLWSSGAMNRSVTVVFSDHGIRFGKIRETYIGKFEERMPFMYLIFPKWFLEKYPDISRNLKINQHRLITLFDIHATLYHLLNFTKPISDNLKSKVTPNGISLLNEISEYRTCEMANILPHWCPCQVYQYIAPDDKDAVKAATALTDEINTMLKPYINENICAKLEIEELTDARLGRANDIVLRFVEHKNDVINRYVAYGKKVSSLNDYLITIRANPGGGMFEGTVRHDGGKGTFKVLGISRINMYGKQSRCINSQILKKFCFCM